MIVLDLSTYRSIVNDIEAFNGLSKFCKIHLQEKYPKISHFTLGSILSKQWQLKMKHNYRKSSINSNYYKEYMKCKDNGESPGILLRLSCKFDISPSLLARSLLDYISTESISKLLKDTTLIQDRDLAYEVYLCNIFDNEYGRYGDRIKHCFGKEYEQRLEFHLNRLKISYITEDALRNKGYDKTPDIKLILPIAIDGFVINWIESKALFGDDKTHEGYLKDQLLCYWNRFGPGLVIYWFGYLDVLEKSPETNKIIILRDGFPSAESITRMNLSLLDT